ncbi:MAG: carboxylating nicotinate-nucleotide diphosphorylase [Dehalococcoidia bacterium]|nr:carboxylating nicotinate-nucleotide diphosphorylase [Dehalococcoidia bacterium]MYA54434.1 carboxylating nicotinate-nucleotide diphosphorylase [Dehalococcoidia bacterium]
MPVEPPPVGAVAAVVRAALSEDRAGEDVTTQAVVDPDLVARGRLVAREAGVVCVLVVARHVFATLDEDITFEGHVADGDGVDSGTTLATVTGPAQAILTGERTALNLVQHLSGIATLTGRYVEAAAGTDCVILDTRKTTPGLRDLDKYAVRCGGGANHRRDLAVMAMIKDNHREAIARQGKTLAQAVATIRQHAPATPIEIEVDTLAELQGALDAKPEWILLDNMTAAEMREAVAITRGKARLEASGGITLERVAEIAATGVDAISVGALTHSAPALDVALDIDFEGEGR